MAVPDVASFSMKVLVASQSELEQSIQLYNTLMAGGGTTVDLALPK